jgi:transcriptional regulator with XRE-family HTH domain|nr:MAG TPA: repressor protein [Caudoviricetes sp.]
MLLKNIETLCSLRGISVSALEKTLGFGNSTISKWAKCSPTVEKLAMVANYFGVTVDDLLKEKRGRKR